jgi:acetate kinase
MRTLIEARQRDPRAERAIAMFCRSVRGAVGALAATLGGVDQLVFTGGIGERAPAIRAEICEGLEYLGISIDAQRNAVGASAIAEPDGACSVRVVVADENRVIARHTASVVRADPAAASPMR